MKRLALLVTTYPKLILAAFVALTLFFGYGLRYQTTDLGELSFIIRNDPDRAFYDEVREVFGFEHTLVVGLSGTDVFSPATLEKIDRISRRALKLDHVEDVQSLTTIEDIVGTAEGFDVRDLVEALPLSPEESERVRRRSYANPIIAKNLITSDGRSTFIIIFLEDLEEDAEAKNALVNSIDRIASEEAGPEEIDVLGDQKVWTEVGRFQRQELPPLLLLTFAAMAAILYSLFRSFRGVLLPLTACSAGVLWTVGLCGWIGKPVDPMINIIPSVLIAVGVAYIIHLIMQYNEEAAASSDRKAIVQRALEHVGRPIALSGLTTAVGFSSLIVNQIPVISEWGPSAAFGVLSITLVALVLMPAILVILPTKKRQKNPSRGGEVLAGLMARTNATVARRRSLILLCSLPVAVASIAGALLVRVETNPVFYFHRDSVLYRAFSYFDDRQLGPWGVPVSIQGEPNSITNPEVLLGIDGLQKYLESLPNVNRVNTIVDFVKLMNQATYSDDPKEHRIPDTRQAVAQYLLLYSLSGDESRLARFINHDYSHAYVMANYGGFAPVDELRQTFKEISDFVESNPIPGVVQRLTGDIPVRMNASLAIVTGMLQSIAIAVIIITAIMALLFRSLVAGLFCMVPNIFPIIVNFGIMGFAGINLDIGTAVISSVVIGIAVDSTIHFLVRYRREFALHRNHSEAAQRTFGGTGRAITSTSLTLFVGFLILTVSKFTPTSYFGLLVAITMVSCLIGDLVLLPALILRYKPKFIEEP